MARLRIAWCGLHRRKWMVEISHLMDQHFRCYDQVNTEIHESLQKVGVDTRIDDVVLRAMESEREKRYPSAREMRTELDIARAGPVPPPVPDTKEKSETNEPTMTTTTITDRQVTKKRSARPFGIIVLCFLALALTFPVLMGGTMSPPFLVRPFDILCHAGN